MNKITATLIFITALFESIATDSIQIWPRNPSVIWPSNLEQFMYIELGQLELAEKWTLKLELPQETQIKGMVRGIPPTVPGLKDTLVPSHIKQDDTLATLFFEKQMNCSRKSNWLPLHIVVKTKPGDYNMKITVESGNKTITKKEFKVKVYPSLSGNQPDTITVGTYDYPGLDVSLLEYYGNMLRGAGINAVYHMRGEYDDRRKTFSDLAPHYGMRNGLVFGFDRIEEFFLAHELPGRGKIKIDSLAGLLAETPDQLREMMTFFFKTRFGGKNYTTVIYDAEAGGFRNGQVRGKFTPGALKAFRKYAKLSPDTALNREIIQKKYIPQWISFYCQINYRYACLIRDVLDQHFPGIRYEIYSGYQYDYGPLKNHTREVYGTDWNLMKDSGIDYATAGYHGKFSEIAHTTTITGSQAPFIPAEMYAENFLSRQKGGRLPESWSMRLIESFLNGSRKGLMLWYANVFDGAALVAIDRLTSFIKQVEGYMTNTREEDLVKISPEHEQKHLYLFRQEGSLLIVVLNPDRQKKRLRLNLEALRLTGHASDSVLSDLATGKKITAKSIVPIDIEGYSYRILHLANDGN